MNNNNVPPNNPQLSRRHFLSTASKAVAGGALIGALPVNRFAHGASGQGPLKLALIGCGGRGSGAANQALTTGKVQLVAMADVFPDRLQSSLTNLRNRHSDKINVTADRQFIGFHGYKDAIAEADVVILGTPPGFRPMQFEEAVKQGKHCFLEKPVATDAPGIRRMLKATEESKKKNLKVVVGLQRHYQPSYIETIKRIHDGAIGDVVAMRCYWNDAGVWVKPREPGWTEMEYQMHNWYYFVWLSGDHIVEQHVHNIDVCNWVKGEYPTKARGMGGREVRTGKEYGQIYDHHAVEFEYQDGTRLFSQCRHMRGCWNNVSEHVMGSKGIADVGGGIIRGDERWRYRSRTRVDPYQEEHEKLMDAIINDTPLNDGYNGTMSTLNGIMGRLATYSGQQILSEDVLESEIDLFPETLAWDAMPKDLPNDEGFYSVAVPGQTVVV